MRANIKKDNKARNLLRYLTDHKEYFKLPVCTKYCKYETSTNKQTDSFEGRIHNINNEDCVCGKRKEKHAQKEEQMHSTSSEIKKEWALGTNTRVDSCYSFGEMIFSDPANMVVEGTRSKYIRLTGFNKLIEDVSTSAKTTYKDLILKLMCDVKYWAMPQPQLIIEVTGTAVDRDIEGVDYKVVEDLKLGIVKAARDAGGWIVTGGSNSGIMKLVGDEVGRQHRLEYAIPCLGIASWGVVKNRAFLEHKKENFDVLESNCYEPNKPRLHQLVSANYNLAGDRTKGTYLNHGHNYFLLIDNGRECIYGEEIDFRNEMVHHIATKVGKEIVKTQNNTEEKLPIVMLAVGGGIGTLQTIEVCLGITSNSNLTTDTQSPVTPVVIPYGFHGASDLVADVFLEFVDKATHEGIEEYLKQHPCCARTLGKAATEESHKKLIARMVKLLERVKARPDLLTVFCSGNKKSGYSRVMTRSLDDAILHAAAANYSAILALKLARQWNAFETAQDTLERNYDCIQRDLGQKDKREQTEKEIRKIALSAVAFGQVNFLELLVKYRLLKEGDLTHEEAYGIFQTALESNNSIANINATALLKSVADGNSTEYDFWKGFMNLGKCFSKMLGCYITNPFKEEGFYDACKENRTEDENSKGSCLVACSTPRQRVPDEQEKKKRERLQRITQYRDVFLLQLALNQQEMAIYLWQRSGDLIGTALIASVFLRNLAKLAAQKDRHVLGEAYLENSEIWEQRARDVLDEFDEFMQSKSAWTLNRFLYTWQDRSVFEIAFYGRCMTFVEHPAVQKKLTHIWYGRISSFTRSLWVYSAALCPPLVMSLSFIPYDASNKLGGHDTGASSHNLSRAIQHFFGKRDKVDPIAYNCKRSKNSFHLSQPCRGENPISLDEALSSLYHSSMVRYFFQTLFQFAFLLLFSSFILNGSLNPWRPDWQEILVLICSACFLMDGLYETYSDDISVANRLKEGKIEAFFRTAVKFRFNIFKWSEVDFYSNYLPLFIGLLILASFVLRMILPPPDYVYPLSTYAIACLLFWIRSMRIFYVSRSIGMIVVILTELLPTTFYFLVVYIFMLLAFAVPVYALISPHYSEKHDKNMTLANNSSLDYHSYLGNNGSAVQNTKRHSAYFDTASFFRLLLQVVYQRWWNLVQIDLDDSRKAVEGVCPIEAEEGGSPASLPFITVNDETCKKEFNIVAIILFCVFIFVTNVAWLNVLIATLSEEVSNIEKDANRLAKFNYLIAVRSVYYRCQLPAPFSIIEIGYRTLRGIVRALSSTKVDYMNGEDIDFLGGYSNENQHKLDEMERHCATIVLNKEKKRPLAIAQDKRMVETDL